MCLHVCACVCGCAEILQNDNYSGGANSKVKSGLHTEYGSGENAI